MPMQPNDLMAALGAPESSSAPKEKKPDGSGYLSSKSPTLKAYLLDAVDSSLSHEERAEALCRAIEENASSGSEDSEEMSEESYPAEY